MMGVEQRHPPQDIAEWLEIATKELVAPAKDRILLEIEAHYAEAVAAHQLEGLSESNARREALAELGDADIAAKRFLKQHLTEREAEKVERWLRRNAHRRDLMLGYVFFLCSCWLLPFVYSGKVDLYRNLVVSLTLMFVLCVVVPTAGFVMIRRKSKNIRLLIIVGAAAFCVYSLSYFYFMDGWGFDSAITLLIFSIILRPDLRTWLKLRHVTDVWDEISLQKE